MVVDQLDLVMLFFGGLIIGICAMAGCAIWLIERARKATKKRLGLL